MKTDRTKQHIVQIVADGHPGGGTTHVLQILRGLRSTFNMTLVTQCGSYLLQEALNLGISCHALDFFRSRIHPSTALHIRALMSRLQPHLVHVHGGRAGFFHALASTGFRTTYTVHGFPFVTRPAAFRKLAIAAERLTSHQADRIIYVSRHDADIARRYRLGSPQKSSKIPNGIQLHRIPWASQSPQRHVGFIGRLEHQKDPRLFLDVMEHLPGYTATMVGGGSLEASLRADIHKRGLGQRVRMLGPLSHQDTLNVLSTLDALVMTSRWEGLPIVVLEAMWSGVPVVAVNVSGLNEAIMHGTSGMLVDGRSAGELAYTVVQATRDPALRMALIEQARQRVRLLFTQDKMLSELRKVYEETLQQAGGSDLATGLRCSTTTQRPSISFGSR